MNEIQEISNLAGEIIQQKEACEVAPTWRRHLATGAAKRFLAKLWSDERGISSVEYALLLSFVAAGVIIGAETLSNAIENEMTDTAALLDEDPCGNDGGGDGTGGTGGTGEGGDNTC